MQRPSTPKIVAYYRVSTARQGRSGLGLDAQRRMVEDYSKTSGAPVVAEFTEIESGRSPDRPHLKAAIAKAKALRAALVVAKLDRMGRRASEVLSLLDLPDLKVVFADSPNAEHLQIGVLALVAEQEALAISARTKAALAAAKARGKTLGNPQGAAALLRHQKLYGNAASTEGSRKKAYRFARDIWSEIQPLIAEGLSDRAIATRLNSDEVPTRRQGGRWHEATVRRVRKRIET